MKRLLALLLLTLSCASHGAMIHYDYDFDYYDITDCDLDCAPAAQQGTGSMTVDTETFSVRSLRLTGDAFHFDWTGTGEFQVHDEDSVDGGTLLSLSAFMAEPDYDVQLYLDLFFIPNGATTPLAYFENVVEEYSTVKNGESTWAMFGQFQKQDAHAVPEPATWMLIGLALLGLILARYLPPSRKDH